MPVRRLDALGRRHALAGQRGLVDLQRARLDDPPVRRHLVTGRQQDDVADDDLLGGDLGLGSVASDARGRLHHRLERVHRALRLALLAQADDGVEHRDHDQQDAGAPLLDRERHDRRAEQDHLHVAAVLVDESSPARDLRLDRQRVGAVALEQLGRLLRSRARPRDQLRAVPGCRPRRRRTTCPPSEGATLGGVAAPSSASPPGAVVVLARCSSNGSGAAPLGACASSASLTSISASRCRLVTTGIARIDLHQRVHEHGARRRSARTTCDRPGSHTTVPTPCSCATASSENASW